MRAMVLRQIRRPLVLEERPNPLPGPGEIRVRVEACAVCRTDLHVVDGDLPDPKLPIVPGHEIVGVADAAYAFRLDGFADPVASAPLLCAGLIGWRSLVAAGEARTIGLYGFGAAAHIIAQVCRWQGRTVFAFTRPGDAAAQTFARALGAAWAGGSDEAPPEPLDAALIFAPVGNLVPAALRAVRKGGRVVCGGIHMSDIPSFPYRILWEERQIVSIANLTRQDAIDFLAIAPKAGIRTETVPYPLERANEALADLREGRLQGAAVLIP